MILYRYYLRWYYSFIWGINWLSRGKYVPFLSREIGYKKVKVMWYINCKKNCKCDAHLRLDRTLIFHSDLKYMSFCILRIFLLIRDRARAQGRLTHEAQVHTWVARKPFLYSLGVIFFSMLQVLSPFKIIVRLNFLISSLTTRLTKKKLCNHSQI